MGKRNMRYIQRKFHFLKKRLKFNICKPIKDYFKLNWPPQIWIFLIAYSCIWIFYPFFEQVYIKYVVQTFLVEWRQYWFTDLFCFIFFIIGIYRITKQINGGKYLPSLRCIIYTICFTLLYIKARDSKEVIDNVKIYFKSFGWFGLYQSNILYSDVIFFALVLITSKLNKPQKKAKTKIKNHLIEDAFSTFNYQDCLNRKSIASHLAELISNTAPKNSYGIGVEGNWGSGKSVFIHLIKEYLDINKIDYIKIEFHPWCSKNYDTIVQDFLKEFKARIEEYYPKISKKISNYANSLESTGNEVGNFLLNNVKFFNKTKNADEQYDSIKKSLEKINNKIIVIIDDLDRLHSKEILEVFKIVRNTCNFPNTFFILAYDKEYINKAIDELSEHNNRSYLEKIVQLEITLPSYPINDIFKVHDQMLKKTLDGELYEIVITALRNLQKCRIIPSENDKIDIVLPSEYNLYNAFLINIRDVIRFTNYFLANYHDKIKDKVVLEEFILLEFLKLKFLELYYALRNKTFLTISGVGSNAKLIINDENLDCFLKEYNKSRDVNNVIKTTLKFLFINGNKDEVKAENIRSIIYEYNFNTYFFPDISGILTQNDIENLLNSNSKDKLVENLKLIELQNKQEDIRTSLFKIRDFKTPIRFENAIKIAINLYLKDCKFYTLQVLEILSDLSIIKNDIYKGKTDDFIIFLKDILNKAEFPYLMESSIIFYFVNRINKNSIEFEMIPKNDLQKINLNYLQKYLDKKCIIDEDCIKIYRNNYETTKEDITIINPEAKRIIQEFYRVNPNILYDEILISKESLYALSDNIIKYFFDSEEYLKQFLFELPDDNFKILELKTFFRRYENNKFKPITFKRGTIEFISDAETIFEGSDSFPHLTGNIPAITFQHPWSNDVFKKYPEYKHCKWIAHTDKITDVEAVEGGIYNFNKTINILFDITLVKRAYITYCVDDELKININNELRLTEFTKTSDYTMKEFDILKYINQGENIISFIIKNVPSKEFMTKNSSMATYKDNPYGIIYSIILEIE